MSLRRDSLELIQTLLSRGILPRNTKPCYIDYSIIKNSIKKKTRCDLRVKEISVIFSSFLDCICNELFLNSELIFIDLSYAKKIFLHHCSDLLKKTEANIRRKFSVELFKQIVDIIIESTVSAPITPSFSNFYYLQ